MAGTRTLTATLPADSLYVSGRVNGVDTIWTNTEGQTWETTAARSADDSYLVELTIVNGLGVTTNQTMTLYYGLHLVTDRTAVDVAQRNEKGTYNAEDLNRVIFAEEYLVGRLTDMGYAVVYRKIPIDSTGRTLWEAADIPTASQLAVYIDNLKAIRAAVPQLPATPTGPDSMSRLTYGGANNIERILEATEYILGLITQAYYYSGEVFSGEV